METPPNPRRIHPTHRVWAVIKRPNAEKGHWTEIGAAWINGDGKGLNLKLDFLPINGHDIVVRQIEEKDDKEGGAA